MDECRDPTSPTYTEQVVTATTARVERTFRQRIVSLEAANTLLTGELSNIKSKVLNTVHGLAFLTDRHHETFQMQGRYDGAMSEKCKAMFRDEHAFIGKLLEEFGDA